MGVFVQSSTERESRSFSKAAQELQKLQGLLHKADAFSCFSWKFDYTSRFVLTSNFCILPVTISIYWGKKSAMNKDQCTWIKTSVCKDVSALAGATDNLGRALPWVKWWFWLGYILFPDCKALAFHISFMATKHRQWKPKDPLAVGNHNTTNENQKIPRQLEIKEEKMIFFPPGLCKTDTRPLPPHNLTTDNI